MSVIEKLVDEIYEHDQDFNKNKIQLMLEAVMHEENADRNTLIGRYAPHTKTLAAAWTNLKKFFGSNSLPKAWFYPEMDRDVSANLVMKSVYNEMDTTQQGYFDQPEIKAMLAPYEGQTKYFLVRHCILRSQFFTVVRLEKTRTFGRLSVSYSRYWFGANTENKFQAVDMSSNNDAFIGPAYDNVDDYLAANFANANVDRIIVTDYSHATRNYLNFDRKTYDNQEPEQKE